jgi:hypothetical protein
MTTEYTIGNTDHTALTLPDNGERASILVITNAIKAAADLARYVKERTLGAKGGTILLDPLLPIRNVSSRFEADAAGGWTQSNVTDGGGLYFHVPMQFYRRLTTIAALVIGNTGHIGGGGAHSALPSSKPTLKLYGKSMSAGASGWAQVGSTATDASATKEEYDAMHRVSLSGLTLDAGIATSYQVCFAGESSTNALANSLSLLGIELTFAPN